jgi:hypothetical protein
MIIRGPGNERAGNEHALPLAPAQFVGIPVDKGLCRYKAHEAQRVPHFGIELAAGGGYSMWSRATSDKAVRTVLRGFREPEGSWRTA